MNCHVKNLFVDSKNLVDGIIVVLYHIFENIRELFLLTAEVSGLKENSLVLTVELKRLLDSVFD